MESINKKEEKWKKILTPEEYEVLRKKGTEIPFTGKYLNNKKKRNIQMCCLWKSIVFI